MELSNFLSLICNDSSDSSSKIWFDQDLSPCFRKYILEFVLYTITLILVSYNIGQRLKCSYRLWTLPLALIRLGSSLVLITTFSFYFYDYFFANNTKYQWIDAINVLLILITHLFICYFNFNRNLYHNKRPMNYIIWMIIFFFIQNYDIYRIIIKHLTLIESVYVSVRQSCLVLITFGLLCICCHTCDQPMPPEHPETNESQYLLPDTVIIQSRCLFLPSSQQESSHVINEDLATLAELFTFAWFNPLMKRGYNSLIIDLNDLCSLPFALLPLHSDRIVNFFQSFHAFWSLPVQIAIVLYLLYQQIGLTFLIGLVFAIILIPINKCIASKIAKFSQDMMLYKDERIKVVSEIIYGMRTIKMNTYENYFTDRINDIRQKELRALRGRKYLDAFCVYFWATTPVLISVLTFTTYTLLGNQLTPAKVFTSLALFALLISPLNAFPWVINGLVEANVSLKRVQRFMDIEPIDFDAYYENVPIDPFPILDHRSSLDIRIKQANFSWNSTDYIEPDEISLKNIDLTIVRGSLVLIFGRVGSGKTALLNGILGELNKINGSINVHNAVENGFAFVSQESWIQQMSFRDNILFGKPYNEQLYKRVIDACALENDIKSLGAAGDFKLVGENGVTLSGGQKARLALARAVYQDKDIYLLDDPLSAVDVHVARHLFTNCISGLLKYKTRLLCTHHVQFMDQADYIILVDNGRIVRAGKPNEVLTSAEGLLLSSNHSSQTGVAMTTHKSMIDIEEQVIQTETALENEAEQRCTGTVKFTIWKRYLIAVGIFLSFSIVLSVFLMQASRNVFDWWLSYWTSHQLSLLNIKHITDQTSKKFLNHSLVSNIDARPMFGFATQTADKDFKRFFIIYVSLAIANSLFTLMRAFTFAYGGIAAARKLHKSLLNSLLKCSISFFDATPSGRILNRFSSDTWSVDDSLPFIMNILLANMFSLLGTLVLSCYGLPKFLIVLVPLAIFYYFIQNYYRWTSREIKRISSVALSPVYAHFGETISGLSTIRAFRHVTQFVEHNFLLVSNSIRAQFASLIAGLWLSFRLQLIGIVMVAGVSLIGVIEHVYTIEGSNPALVGLSLSYILSVTGLLNGLISSFTETEKEMIGVERVTAYIDDLPKEEEDNEEQLINLNEERQQKGATIEYRHVTMKYSVDQKLALDNITFQIQSNEKIGIVGRTGSGKSSLLAVLFRLVNLSDGQILIDNVDTTTMRRHTLRQTLAIIPQDPFLFSGTIRENLDPY
ncbi:unnamed protein product, partial [Rotaria magnacalcarata]